LNDIPRSISSIFIELTTSVEIDVILLLVFYNSPYPGLIRLLKHPNTQIVIDAIKTIYNIMTSVRSFARPEPYNPIFYEMK
jgi:hypothetical protein